MGTSKDSMGYTCISFIYFRYTVSYLTRSSTVIYIDWFKTSKNLKSESTWGGGWNCHWKKREILWITGLTIKNAYQT